MPNCILSRSKARIRLSNYCPVTFIAHPSSPLMDDPPRYTVSEREIAQRTDHQTDRPRQARQRVDEIAFTTSHVAFPITPGRTIARIRALLKRAPCRLSGCSATAMPA